MRMYIYHFPMILFNLFPTLRTQYYLAGDHQTFFEGPIEESQIFAKVVSVERAGVWLSEDDRIWKFYAVWWRRLFWLRKVRNKLKRVIGK